MPKISKKLARNVGKGINPTAGTGPLAGPDYDKLFKDIPDEAPTLGPAETSPMIKEKDKKKKKSIFNS